MTCSWHAGRELKICHDHPCHDLKRNCHDLRICHEVSTCHELTCHEHPSPHHRYQSRKWPDREFVCTSLTDLIPFSVKADWQVQLYWNLIRFQPSFISKCPISASCDPNSPILLRFSFKSVRFTLILPVWQSLKYYLLTGLVISGYKTVPKIEHIELDSQNSNCNRTRNHMFLGV